MKHISLLGQIDFLRNWVYVLCGNFEISLII